MKASERDDLIAYLDNEAGPQPSKVNAAHEAVQVALSKADIGTALTKTIEAEGYNGQVGRVLQTLRDKIAAITVDPPEAPPELPPVVVPGVGGTVGTLTLHGPVIQFTAYEGTIYSAYCATDGNPSWTCSSGGVKCFISLDPTVPADSQWGAGASPDLPVKAGDTIYMRMEGAAVQGARVSMPH